MSRGGSARQRRTTRRKTERLAAVGLQMAPSGESGVEAALTAGASLPEIDQALESLDVWAAAADPEAPVLAALTAAGIEDNQSAPITTYDLTNGTLCERRFYAAVLEAGYSETRRAAWPSEAALGDHGEVLFRDDSGGVFRLDDGTLVYAHINGGWFSSQVAAPSRKAAAGAVDAFASAYPPLFRDHSQDGTVSVTFWTNSKWGPTSRLRRIEASPWETIGGNYTAPVKVELERLMSPDFEPGKDGQLLLWQGSPGTGKTWALRALASQWAGWAEFNYITDPDAFFVSQPSYMIDVLLSDSYEVMDVEGDVVTETDVGKWRVLILEDTGELLSANARETYAQGLSRLLNVVDGMVGQGLRVLAIVTTNDELGELHPAVTRPGRCASQIEFGPLTEQEADGWLHARGFETTSDGPKTLAELYALDEGAENAFADEEEDTVKKETLAGDTLADDDTMPCADCGHKAMSHAGDDNMGACAIDECDCKGFAMEDEAAATALPFDVTTNDVVVAGNTTTYVDNTTGLPGSFVPVGGTAPMAPAQVTFTLKDLTFIDDHGALHTITASPAPVEDVVVTPPESSGNGGMQWVATLCPEGRPTDDGRIFAPGSITWRDLPLTLMGMIETQEGHDGAQVCGRIDRVWRDAATGEIMGAGEFDTGEFGTMIARLVGDGTLRGVSVDIAVGEMEILPRDEVVDENGNWIADLDGEREEVDPMDALFGGDAMMFVVTKGIIGAATVCPFPAFADAKIEVAASLVAAAAPNVWTVSQQARWGVIASGGVIPATGDAVEALLQPGDLVLNRTQQEALEPLTASAAGIAPVTPPAEWFDDPQLEELTPLSIDDDGRVFGHVAPWGVCHVGIPGVCTTAPTTDTNYAYYMTKEVVCEDGSRVAVGTITLETDHAGRDLGRAAASAHYDNTGVAAADIVVGEDEFGIWCAGAVRGDLDEHKVRALRGASLSGDWREVNGNLELIGVLAVNVPGFPIPRLRASLVASGDDMKVTSLIAAGVIGRPDTDRGALTRSELRELELIRDKASGAYEELAAIAFGDGQDTFLADLTEAMTEPITEETA